MRAKFINEKFVEYSDPVEDLGIGTRKQISKFMKELDAKDTDDNALAECARYGKTEWVKFLLARGANVHAWSDYALRLAAENGHTETVQVLLDAGADVHAIDDYALRWAAENGHTETVKVLLDAGADVHAKDDYALRWAAEKGHTEIVQVLKDHIAKEKQAKRAKKIKESLSEKFVEDSDPVEDLGLGTRKKISRWMEDIMQTDTDDNALCQCAWYGKTEWAKFLLARGADVRYFSYRALTYAAYNGYTEIVKMILDTSVHKGYDISRDNPYMNIAANYAKDRDYEETSKVIIDYMTKYKKAKKAKKVNEKFTEDSDPVEDLNISTIHKIQKRFKEELQYYIDVYVPDNSVVKIQDKDQIGYKISYPGSDYYFELTYLPKYKIYEIARYRINNGRIVEEDEANTLEELINIFDSWFMTDLDRIEKKLRGFF